MVTDYLRTPSVLSEHVLHRWGCPIHYWMGGDVERPLVVMMHGATMDRRMFNAQITALIPEYRVLVWDARGHGESQPSGEAISLDLYAEDMLAILDDVRVERFVALGQSLGGYIAQHLYRLAPNRINAMVIIGAVPVAKSYSRLEIWALKASLPILNLWPHGDFARMVARNTAVDESVRRYALDAVQRIPRNEFRRIWRAVTLAVDTNGDPDFHLSVPALLMHGEHDRTGTIKRDMPVWAAQEPTSEFHVIPNAGHNANQDNPEVVNALLLAFLRAHVRS